MALKQSFDIIQNSLLPTLQPVLPHAFQQLNRPIPGRHSTQILPKSRPVIHKLFIGKVLSQYSKDIIPVKRVCEAENALTLDRGVYQGDEVQCCYVVD
jgi:hypothetical protein